MAATPIDDRQYTCDVDLMSVVWDGLDLTPTPISFLGRYKDATLRIDKDMINAYIPRDTVDYDGFEHDVMKAQRWSLDLSTHDAADGNPASRKYSWEVSALTNTINAINIVKLFTSLDVSYTCNLMEARIPIDTAAKTGSVETSGNSGWAHPRPKTRSYEFEFQGMVDAVTPGNNPFDLVVPSADTDTNDGDITFDITGPNIEIAGTGVALGGQLSFGDETMSQNLRLKARAAPTITSSADWMILNNVMGAATGGANRHIGLVGVYVYQPGNPTKCYYGKGFFTSAKFNLADGPIMQSGTISGFDALLKDVSRPA